jgi:hypothetical protein
MIAVALKGVAGRKVRALLTALAVVIGVTMVSGTLVLTDTIQKGFDNVFGASYVADRRGDRRPRGGDHASPPYLAAECPRRTALRVTHSPEAT